ncbi:hypothetical protein [uncultured Ruthenibacterium sp.]|uniref:hypothetical protein n=1 Tax=uncultured Ruthenibacterium sp. TaxID=1905347 RepID=UPI00349EED52
MAALDALWGNDTLKQSLSAALAAGRLSHSVLLCGEAGTGANFAARCLAADYLYPQGGAGAAQVLSGESPELLILQGEGVSGDIKIDAVRTVRREVYNTALSAQGRVVLIKGAHKLNAASANALLKVIEEPPEGVLFLLTAPGEAVVLPTIRSRCCAYSLAPVSQAECVQYLNTHFPACKNSAGLAGIFGGKIGSARRCIEDPQQERCLNDALSLAKCVARHDSYKAMVLLSGYEKDRFGILRLLELFGNVCSAALRGTPDIPVDAAQAAQCLPSAFSASRAVSANVNAKLVLTNLAVQLCA